MILECERGCFCLWYFWFFEIPLTSFLPPHYRLIRRRCEIEISILADFEILSKPNPLLARQVCLLGRSFVLRPASKENSGFIEGLKTIKRINGFKLNKPFAVVYKASHFNIAHFVIVFWVNKIDSDACESAAAWRAYYPNILRCQS